MRMLAIIVMHSFLVLPQSFAQQSKVAPELKAGADFVWFLTKIEAPADLQKCKSVKLSLEQESAKDIGQIIRDVHQLEMGDETLVSTIHYLYQKDTSLINITGEQTVVYCIQTEVGESMFFEVRMLCRQMPPTVKSVKSVSRDSLDKMKIKNGGIAIPQKAEE